MFQLNYYAYTFRADNSGFLFDSPVFQCWSNLAPSLLYMKSMYWDQII